MTKHHMKHVQPVSYEWSPIQRHCKNQNLRHKTIIATTHPHKSKSEHIIHHHTRSKPYQVEMCDESGDSCSSAGGRSSVRSGQDISLSMKIFWYKYFGCFSFFRKKSNSSRVGERHRKGLSQVLASLDDDDCFVDYSGRHVN